MWNYIKKAINSDLDTPLNDRIDNHSVIKSIQRGTSTGNSDGSNRSITISAVDPTKCSIRLEGSWGGTNSYGQYMPRVSSIASTTLTIAGPGFANDADSFSWEVVEYV